MQKGTTQDPKSSNQPSPSKKEDALPKKLTLQELVKHRVERQDIVQSSYTDVPLIEEKTVKTFEDLTYKLSDQHDFLIDKHEEMKTQFSGHYMTQMNKKLIQENKDLKSRIESTMTKKMKETIQKEKEQNIEKQLTTQEIKIDTLEKQLIIKEKEIEMLKDDEKKKLNQAHKEHEDLKMQIIQLKGQGEQLQIQLHQTQQEILKIKEENQSLNAQLHNDQKNLQQLNNQQIKDLQRQLAEKDQQIKDQNKKDLQQQQQLMNQINQQVSEMEQNNQALSQENQKLIQDNADLFHAYQQQEQHNKELQDQLTKHQKIVLELKEQINQLKQSESKASLSPVRRDPRFMDAQEKQLDSDMQFSQELLKSIRKSNQGSQSRKNIKRTSLSPSEFRQKQQQMDQEEQQDFYTFAQNTRGVQYLAQELEQLKDQIYNKLKFLQIKVARENEHTDVEYGLFKTNSMDHSLFLKEEVNHMQIISNIVNEIILQTDEAFMKIHEIGIKKQLVELLEEKDLSITLQDIILKIQEKYESLSQENTLYKAEIEQNLDPKIKALLVENQNLRQGNSNGDNNSIKIENDLLKQQNHKLVKTLDDHQTKKDQEIQKYEQIISELYQENDDLIAKAKVLSTNLNYLANEVEQLKETNEKMQRENDHIRKQYQKIKQQDSSTKRDSEYQAPSRVSQDKSTKSAENFTIASKYKRHPRNINNEEENVYDMRASTTKSMVGAQSEYQLRSPQQCFQGSPMVKQEETQKLSKLITDYKIENDRCTQKIIELKEKLQNNKYKFYVDRSSIKEGNNNNSFVNQSNYYEQDSRVAGGNRQSNGTRGFSQPNVNSNSTPKIQYARRYN